MNRDRRGGASRQFAGTHRPAAIALITAGVLAIVTGTLLANGMEPSGGPAPIVTRLEQPAAPPLTGSARPAPDEPPVRPVRLSIPRIGVTAKVTPAGVDQAGAFSVPPSVDTVGWYRFGPALDSPAGSLVIGGHVDSASAGPGAFFRLRELDPGSTLSLTGEDGATRSYVVVAREQIPKDEIDLQPYFATTGSPRITLFTCGGSFDRVARSYRDNIVVTAVPT
ncbi:class F sortase [Amycolatopsis sp. cg9]|uniref:class F sortase n=1 Tax=Amycolatopsis sp. cg9 TaxID=3238801 RepID=UPI0035249596